MRYCEDIAITRTIIHVMDTNDDEAIIGVSMLELDEATYMYLHDHIYKALNSDTNSRGEFLINSSMVYTQCLEMMGDGHFIGGSSNIAKYLFKTLKNTMGGSSGDLIVVEIVVDGKKGIGIMFMEYKPSFAHEIKFEESQFKVALRQHNTSLIPKGQRLGKFAFFGESSDSQLPYELIMMEKTSLDENGEKIEFFISNFLQATVILDYSDITRLFRNQIERWLRKNMKEDIGKAIDVRLELDEQYVNNTEIDIQDVVNNVIESTEEREKFMMTLEKAGVDINEPFEIDKKWVGKKFKRKNLKTDTGFDIKGDFDLFEDNSRFEVQYNGDGTVNYLIKQVRNIHQI